MIWERSWDGPKLFGWKFIPNNLCALFLFIYLCTHHILSALNWYWACDSEPCHIVIFIWFQLLVIMREFQSPNMSHFTGATWVIIGMSNLQQGFRNIWSLHVPIFKNAINIYNISEIYTTTLSTTMSLVKLEQSRGGQTVQPVPTVFSYVRVNYFSYIYAYLYIEKFKYSLNLVRKSTKNILHVHNLFSSQIL